MSYRLSKTLACACILAAVPSGLFAVDGVVLISQPGSAQGFPIVISQPGSYRLDSNLVVPDANTTAIQITASNVNLDLNGFGIFGPTVCSGSPATSCTPSGSGTGVLATNPPSGTSTPGEISVFNGTVHGMGNFGIFILGPGRAENINADSNGSTGIAVTGTVLKCVATRNGSLGIAARIVNDSLAVQNASSGMEILASGTGNSAILNHADGIVVFRATISANSAFLNQGDGINAMCPSIVLFSAATHSTGNDIVLNSIGPDTCASFNNASNKPAVIITN